MPTGWFAADFHGAREWTVVGTLWASSCGKVQRHCKEKSMILHQLPACDTIS